MRVWIVVGAVALVGACGSSSSRGNPTCSPGEAGAWGRAQALRGERLDATLGGRCMASAEVVTAGYEQGRAELCDPDAAYREGQSLGAGGHAAATLHPRYQLCANVPVLEQRTADGLRDGVTTFCDRQGQDAFQRARAAGQAGEQQPKYTGPEQCPPEVGKRAKAEAQRGYREGIAEFCTPTSLATAGRADGEAGRPAADPRATFGACSAKQLKSIKETYSDAYEAGLAKFCRGDGVVAHAEAHARAGRPPDVGATYRVCGAKKRKQIAKRYDAAYAAVLDKVCAGDDVEQRGVSDGEAGRAATAMASGIGACSTKQKQRIADRYASGYENGLAKFCDLGRIAGAAGKAALDGATSPQLPAQFEVCLELFPKVRQYYDKTFAAGREQHVANACTFAAGVDSGRSDAARTNDQNLAMPAYCDRAKFDQYQRGYLDGWKRTKAALCNQIDASRRGVADAQAGRPLSYQAPGLCPAELHAGLLDAYTAGHRSVPPPTTATVATTPATTPTQPASVAGPMAITWAANASSYRAQNGAQIQLSCAATTATNSVWGTDVYTDDSSICSAAVHAGLIDMRGGRVMIEIRPGLTAYKGSTRGGVRTGDYGWFAGSFVFPDARPSSGDGPAPSPAQGGAPAEAESRKRYEACVEWADGEYKRSVGYAAARDRANANCRGAGDLEIAKYVYSFAVRSIGYADAVDVALEASRRPLDGKLPELKFATDGYVRSVGYADAVKRAVAGIAKLQASSLGCIKSNYEAYVRSLGYADAMDKSLAQCAQTYPAR